MLANEELADRFVSGTVYQAFLSPLSYHRWHSSASGTIVKAHVQPGTYYSKSPSADFGSRHTSLGPSQAYLVEVATRAIIIIEAENPEIGLVCGMPIGMAEVSTCEIGIRDGQRVKKGEQLGTFHYGGSTYCLLFQRHVKLEWIPETWEEGRSNAQGRKAIIPVNTQIAVVKPRDGVKQAR